MLQRLEHLCGKDVHVTRGSWRPGDQRIFVADTARVTHDLGWKPRTTVETGIPRLIDWVRQSVREIEHVVADAGELTWV